MLRQQYSSFSNFYGGKQLKQADINMEIQYINNIWHKTTLRMQKNYKNNYCIIKKNLVQQNIPIEYRY